MLARVLSCATVGIEGVPIEVEADIGVGLPSFTIVGLPDAAVRESRERVLAAVRNCGYEFPARRITINLAPAHVRKEGARFDLPIAVALLLASGQVRPPGDLRSVVFVGELALDGTLRPMRGMLAILGAARRNGLGPVWLPRGNACEASALPDVPARTLGSLRELRGDDADGGATAGPPAAEVPSPLGTSPPDLAEVRGQALAKRALEIAAAGGHYLLLVGPPGAGKTMLARRLPGILPPLSPEEAVEVSTIHSVAGRLPPGVGLLRHPPFRAPHHSVSLAGLIGGGRGPNPGEVSLAHHGVLFLDELPEFRRDAIEALRQPMEERTIAVARASGSVSFPAAFSLVAAMNPCPCGWLGHSKRDCRCSSTDLARYAGRVSGPVLDRVDVQIEVPALKSEELLTAVQGDASVVVRERVTAARELQRARGGLNAHLSNAAVREHSALDRQGDRLIADAVDRAGMSARAIHRSLRVARTIADLAGETRVTAVRIAEALHYRTYEARRIAGG